MDFINYLRENPPSFSSTFSDEPSGSNPKNYQLPPCDALSLSSHHFDPFNTEGSASEPLFKNLAPPRVDPHHQVGGDGTLDLNATENFAEDGRNKAMHGCRGRSFSDFLRKTSTQPRAQPRAQEVNYEALGLAFNKPFADANASTQMTAGKEDNKEEDDQELKFLRLRPEMQQKKNQMSKGPWTPEEDSLLVQLVGKVGLKWAQVSQKMKRRVGKQCRERWHNHLRPDIKKGPWTREEEAIIVETHRKVGNRWCEIALRLPGRTENAVKNHWNANKRRMQCSKRKGQRPTSFFQEYIKRVSAESSSLRGFDEHNVVLNLPHQAETRSFKFNGGPIAANWFAPYAGNWDVGYGDHGAELNLELGRGGNQTREMNFLEMMSRR